MTRLVSSVARSIAVAALALGSTAPLAAQGLAPVTTNAADIATARADSAERPYTRADVAFMTGMVHHHAQAVLMASWAPAANASDAVRTLCARIANAQRDEIRYMQQWLIDRRQPVPVPVFSDTSMTVVMTNPRDTTTASVQGMHQMTGMQMPGMQMAGAHATLMPGMLTQAQLDTLHAARGQEFDLLFLRYMIQHHTGAVTMVHDLFASTGGAQDEIVFKLAADINVDQTTEIARMRRMLVDATLGIQSR
jgi:uncharacterized protein (DUF305 family)